MESFPAKLKVARQQAGLSQQTAATPADIAVSTWSRLEQGKQQPTLTTLQRIAKTLNVDPRDLL